jgi:hypothetical protein
MFSLSKTLQGLAKTNHLPIGFNASQGVRSLLPSGRGNTSIAILKNYLYSQKSQQLAAGDIQATFDVFADGSGRWLYQAVIGLVQPQNASSGRWGAGFVFAFSTDKLGRGYVKTGDYSLVNTEDYVDPFAVTLEGFDSWITNHWPELFAQSSFVYLSSATGFVKLPDVANAATDNGFAGLASLQGAKYTSEDKGEVIGNPSGGGGGGSRWPPPVDWESPPPDTGGGGGG